MKCIAFACLIVLAGCSTAPAEQPKEAAAQQRPGRLKITGHECDDAGGVRVLRVVTDGATEAIVSWDNRVACGDPT